MAPLKMRTQFGLLNCLLVLITVGVVSVASFATVKSLLIDRLQAEQRRQARALAEVCLQGQLVDNDVLMLNFTKLLARSEGIAYAFCADKQGLVRAHTDARFVYKPVAEWRAAAPAAVEVASSAESMEAAIGFQRPFIERSISEALTALSRRVLMAAGAAVATGLLFGAAFSVVMTRPIRRLAGSAVEIGKGNFNERVELGSSQEVAELAGVFNKMAMQLAALDEMKTDFVNMVSHDMRSPLSAIISYADLLTMQLKGPLNEAQSHIVAVIANNGQRLTHFINDILDVSKIKAGKMQYSIKPMDLGPAVARTAELFALIARMRSAAIESSVPNGLMIQGDEEKIERVLTNLVSNAIKFLPTKGGRIQISAGIDGPWVVVSVRDNGRGIAAEDIPRLFQKFEQLDVEAQKNLKIVGTGLGLSLVKSVIEAHGGKVWVESELGAGSDFRFTVPRAV